jgi:hypothetical protein
LRIGVALVRCTAPRGVRRRLVDPVAAGIRCVAARSDGERDVAPNRVCVGVDVGTLAANVEWFLRAQIV